MSVHGSTREITLRASTRSTRRRTARTPAAIAALLATLCAAPTPGVAKQAGDLDARFGAAGKVLTYVGSSNNGAAAALQADGRIVVAGPSFSLETLVYEFALSRYLPDGNLDASFGGDGVVTTSFGDSSALIQSLALQPDGRLVAGGYFIDATGASVLALARYLPTGALDTTFSGDGKLIMDVAGQVNAIVLQPDGKIVAVGSAALVRVDANGALDAAFGAGGVVSVDFEQLAAAWQPDGKIVTAGHSFDVSTSQRQFALARFLSNGALDMTFHGDGRVDTNFGGGGDASASALALQGDGKIVAVGNVFSVANGHVDFALARYSSDGMLDSTFGGDGRVTTDFGDTSAAAAVTVQPDLRIVAAGQALGMFGLARYLPNGALDRKFGDGGVVTTSFGVEESSLARGLLRQPDGRLVAAGSSTRTGEGGFTFAAALARYLSK